MQDSNSTAVLHCRHTPGQPLLVWGVRPSYVLLNVCLQHSWLQCLTDLVATIHLLLLWKQRLLTLVHPEQSSSTQQQLLYTKNQQHGQLQPSRLPSREHQR
jgi:hypothetical protein